ncbi:MAG: aminotransferase DegT [Flavobacteriaceae bacterium]|nr:aminotransferase DegT [Flavobacteriaceae bacterium]|tara:strand:- start:16223 stop:17317 length:1095 start_codon:yes stop_codon:yes gene_type:complete
MIPVVKPFLPPKEEYLEYISGIWKRNWLTNMGPLSNELELKISEYLKVKNLLYVNNGTIGLQMAIKALELKGDIITTPFSFVATTSSIVWEGCKPIFVDICSKSLNIDAAKIEEKITENTCAILATHVYGNPCDVYLINEIANKYGLKVIYDAAHAFGVKVGGESIFKFGDIAVCSLHATKLYHSIEGGFVVCNSDLLFKKLTSMRNFGFETVESFSELGINAKNSEFHSAMGLANLTHIGGVFDKRKTIFERYNKKLSTLNARRPKWFRNSENNYAYYPLIFEKEKQLNRTIDFLNKYEVFTRRYFYPSLASSLPYVERKELQITDEICEKILCLPFYTDLSIEEVDLISSLILKVQNDEFSL